MLCKRNKEKGFTLIEVLVSLSIFAFVATAGVGVLLVMVDSNRKAQNMQTVMTNLSFSLDSMTRDIRTGTNFYVSNSDTGAVLNQGSTNNDGTGVVFGFDEGGGSLTSNQGCGSGGRIAFKFNSTNGRLERMVCAGTAQATAWEPITDTDVIINDMWFVLSGSDPADNYSPSVTIFIDGSVGGIRSTGADFQIQTTVTQRQYDIN